MPLSSSRGLAPWNSWTIAPFLTNRKWGTPSTLSTNGYPLHSSASTYIWMEHDKQQSSLRMYWMIWRLINLPLRRSRCVHLNVLRILVQSLYRVHTVLLWKRRPPIGRQRTPLDYRSHPADNICKAEQFIFIYICNISEFIRICGLEYVENQCYWTYTFNPHNCSRNPRHCVCHQSQCNEKHD